jgi:hypothetical protein
MKKLGKLILPFLAAGLIAGCASYNPRSEIKPLPTNLDSTNNNETVQGLLNHQRIAKSIATLNDYVKNDERTWKLTVLDEKAKIVDFSCSSIDYRNMVLLNYTNGVFDHIGYSGQSSETNNRNNIIFWIEEPLNEPLDFRKQSYKVINGTNTVDELYFEFRTFPSQEKVDLAEKSIANRLESLCRELKPQKDNRGFIRRYLDKFN